MSLVQRQRRCDSRTYRAETVEQRVDVPITKLLVQPASVGGHHLTSTKQLATIARQRCAFVTELLDNIVIGLPQCFLVVVH